MGGNEWTALNFEQSYAMVKTFTVAAASLVAFTLAQNRHRPIRFCILKPQPETYGLP